MKVFKYSAIGKNTVKNREHLEKLGYVPLTFFINNKYIYTKSIQRANAKDIWIEYYFETHNGINLFLDGVKFIDCHNNDKLFRYITNI